MPAETPAQPAARGPGLDQPVKPGAALALRKEPAPKPRTATPQEQLERFAKDLRDLRTQAGLGYPEMAELSHYTMKTLASAAGGLNLPTLPVTMAYVRACEGSVPEWEDRWHRLADAMKPASDDAQAAAGSDGGRHPDGVRESDGNRRDGHGTGDGNRTDPRDGRDPGDPSARRDPRDGNAPRDPRDGRGQERRGGAAARPSQVSTPPSAPSGPPGTPAAQQAPPGAPEQVYVITSAPRRPYR